jgi:hypothetical protein
VFHLHAFEEIYTMALNIRSRETEKLAEQMTALLRETKSEAVTKALQARLNLIRRERTG